MFDVIAKLHDLAEKLEDKYSNDSLSERLDKVAEQLVEAYKAKVRRQKKTRGIKRTKQKLRYKRNRQKLKRKNRLYKRRNKMNLKRRKKLKHYKRFG